jgi:LSD1 subclass zinc finger protein
MAMRSVTCEGCGRTIKVTEGATEARCGKCGDVTRVTQAAPTADKPRDLRDAIEDDLTSWRFRGFIKGCASLATLASVVGIPAIISGPNRFDFWSGLLLASAMLVVGILLHCFVRICDIAEAAIYVANVNAEILQHTKRTKSSPTAARSD